MWCAVGYPPCCYAVPVWVAAGESLPQLLSGDAPASRLASTLKGKVYPLTEPGLERYADLRVLRSILPLVRKAEKEELRLGRRLDSSMRKDGFDPEAVKAFNAAADDRFDAFRKAVLRHASE